MIDEYCPKCGNKTFEYTGCGNKYRCTIFSCRYFLYVKDFEELKSKGKEK